MNAPVDDAIQPRGARPPPSGDVGITVVVLSGIRKGLTRPLGARMSVGKGADNNLCLPDHTVSQRHCELFKEPDGIRVVDLGSTNGTHVEGLRVETATVAPGTVLRIGEVEVALRAGAPRVDVLPSKNASFGDALGESPAMRAIFGVLERVAPTDATVLLEGEAGTGKDVLARSICAASPRNGKPFVVVDCGAVAHTQIESELFGHERGAVASRHGAIELAEGGTLFLDEVGDLPLDVQPKLLRAIETKEFRRVGGSKTLHANVRVLAATKRNLQREVHGGKFREDLYLRLAVVPLTIPPLRARREDVPVLARHILAAAGSDQVASDAALHSLAAHDWPGNVRELRNVLERAIDMSQAAGSKELALVSLPVPDATIAQSAQDATFLFDAAKTYRETRAKHDGEFEKRYVKWLLGRHGGNVSAAAREARMDRKHLHDMAKKHGLRGEPHEG